MRITLHYISWDCDSMLLLLPNTTHLCVNTNYLLEYDISITNLTKNNIIFIWKYISYSKLNFSLNFHSVNQLLSSSTFLLSGTEDEVLIEIATIEP
jgi:hypothetical protein